MQKKQDDKKDSVQNLEENIEEVKQERLIYFYSPNDDLERGNATPPPPPLRIIKYSLMALLLNIEIQNLRKSDLETASMGSIVKSSTCNSVLTTIQVPRVSKVSATGFFEPSRLYPEEGPNEMTTMPTTAATASNNLPIDLLFPPLITHTAATPQGSPPSSALDSISFYIEIDRHDQQPQQQQPDQGQMSSASFSQLNRMIDGGANDHNLVRGGVMDI